jgi:hypothetical protein
MRKQFADIQVIFPDPPVWQAGLEFGVEGLARARRKGLSLTVSILDHGPMVEAITCALLQFDMLNCVLWHRRWPGRISNWDVAVFPRVRSIDNGPLLKCLRNGLWVLSSDPNFKEKHPRLGRLPPRDAGRISEAILDILKAQSLANSTA